MEDNDIGDPFIAAQVEVELEEQSYARYRKRGGQLRCHPWDLGNEPLYHEQPLGPDCPAGSFHDDTTRLSPNPVRLASMDYRQLIRPFWRTLSPSPETWTALRDAWYHSRSESHVPYSPPPPTPPRSAPETPDGPFVHTQHRSRPTTRSNVVTTPLTHRG